MDKSNKNDVLANFSQSLFWDVDRKSLDLAQSKKLIIERVLEYGLMQDWKLIQKIYGLEEIKNVAVKLRALDEVTLSFFCHLFDLKKSDFRCYTHKQSTPNFW